ncbi:MAG: hypothetical protein HYR48_08640 [Gemmatimonadetes bacterium]|nr:hypothetical protein [Gemmatimonadota bacterium]
MGLEPAEDVPDRAEEAADQLVELPHGLGLLDVSGVVGPSLQPAKSAAEATPASQGIRRLDDTTCLRANGMTTRSGAYLQLLRITLAIIVLRPEEGA